MTAFARTARSCHWGELVWEGRSVNHRHLDVAIRLPDVCRGLEGAVRDLLRDSVARGKLDLALQLSPKQDGPPQIRREHLLTLLATIEQLRRDVPELAEPDPLDLLRWPGVLAPTDLSTAVVEVDVLESFRELVARLVAVRRSEGGHLVAVIRERVDAIADAVGRIRAADRDNVDLHRQRLGERVARMGVQVDENRMAAEIALLAQRSDIAEELDRLDAHLRETRRLLDEGGAVGRRLDFLMQELNREANTLAAKSATAAIAHVAVDVKVLIEQIREQVQNLE